MVYVASESVKRKQLYCKCEYNSDFLHITDYYLMTWKPANVQIKGYIRLFPIKLKRANKNVQDITGNIELLIWCARFKILTPSLWSIILIFFLQKIVKEIKNNRNFLLFFTVKLLQNKLGILFLFYGNIL